MSLVDVECTECPAVARVDTDSGEVTVHIPSNGFRGRRHQPARQEVVQAFLDRGEVLWCWDCPACGHADSTYVDDEVRDALA